MNYRGMIGSLLYLTASKPDIMFNVCLYARCQFDPKKSHPKAVKRVFRYLAGPTNLGMFYEKHNNFTLAGFFDIDYVGDRGERKSTNGGSPWMVLHHFLENCLISWTSNKQNSIALSTTEAEYILTVGCFSQLLWIKYQLEDYSSLESNIPIFCDNTSAINLSKNPIQHSKAKNIEKRYHFIHDYVQKGIFDIKFIDTNHQWGDIFTKTLAKEWFTFLRNHLRLKSILEWFLHASSYFVFICS
uniref:Copia protein n=1 Tax=Cajanus cajan TaxID=3821 RepID=A0A151RGZ5_CAJCA|nr:Copia protein [Cajanus cajan]